MPKNLGKHDIAEIVRPTGERRAVIVTKVTAQRITVFSPSARTSYNFCKKGISLGIPGVRLYTRKDIKE